MFTITISTSNDAFAVEPKFEVARILKDLGQRLEDNCAGDFGSIRDINGSTVGSFSLTSDSYQGYSSQETLMFAQTWSNVGGAIYAAVLDAAVDAVVRDNEIDDSELGYVAIAQFYAVLPKHQDRHQAKGFVDSIGDRAQINAAEIGDAIREDVDGILGGA